MLWYYKYYNKWGFVLIKELSKAVHTNRVFVVIGLFAVMAILPIALSSFASAALLPNRSVQLSSASAAATGVSYEFEFTTNDPAGAFVVDFCTNSPSVGDPCVAPAGMTAVGASIATSGYSLTGVDANTVAVEATLSGAATFTLDNVTNASAAGLVYARIVTYDTLAHALLYQPDSIGAGTVDGGTVAFSITDTIGVSGSVMESVTFCVSGKAIQANCSGVERPVLKLGEKLGDVTALTASAVSEGAIYAQVSTNAVGGVTVNLKSGALGCGGLVRAGAVTACDIAPALDAGIQAGEAKFGVKVTPEADTGLNPGGVLQTAAGSIYGAAKFTLNYIANNASGVTSVFGDPFLDTDGAPANNKNVKLTFGASVTDATPAGLYSVDLSLIAAGRF